MKISKSIKRVNAPSNRMKETRSELVARVVAENRANDPDPDEVDALNKKWDQSLADHLSREYVREISRSIEIHRNKQRELDKKSGRVEP